MLTIDFSDTYFLDKFEDTIKVSYKKAIPDYQFFPKRKLKKEDIIILKMLKFKPLSDDRDQVENFGMKKYINETNKFIVADTDLNAVTGFMTRGYRDNYDLIGIIRYQEIYEMYKIIKKNAPTDLTQRKWLNYLGFKKSVCILFVNYETRERIFEHVVYNEKTKENDDYFIKYSNKGFIPALKLTEKEIKYYYREFEKFSKNEYFNFGNFWTNERVEYEMELKEEDMLKKSDIIIKAKKFVTEEYMKDKKEKNKDVLSVKEWLEYYKESIDGKIEGIENSCNEKDQDLFPRKTFDRLTLGRVEIERLDEIFNFIEKRNKRVFDNLKYKGKTKELVNILRDEFKSGLYD